MNGLFSKRALVAAPFFGKRLTSSVALQPADIEFLKRFKTTDLPKGTKVGGMVMGDIGLYNEKLRRNVEEYMKAVDEGKPVHEWGGTGDAVWNGVAYMLFFLVLANIGIQGYGLVVDPKPFRVVSDFLQFRKKEK